MSQSLPATSVACPVVETLQELLDGTLANDVQVAVQGHIDQCRSCQQRLEAMTTGSESWIGVADELQQHPQPPDEKLAAAMQNIKGTEAEFASREPEPYAPTQFDLVQEYLLPSTHPGAIGRIGAYEVQEIIGHGGFGAVFKAFDSVLHRVVAVKVLASHLAHHAVARKRFIREAQAAAAVCHENVVTIHAIEEAGISTGTKPCQPKIVMQYVSGGSLQERLDQEGPLELKEILRIGMQTAAGLAAAHAQGLVHRDVKPGNILLENGVQRVKLTDFGLARVVDDASLTLSGVIAGTPQYMSPEQAWGRSVDHRGDLFSLGAVLYAMCVGHSPFRARSTMAVLKRVCEEQPRPIQAINPDVPEWLCAIINRLLAKSPDDRFQSAEQVSELLGGYLAHVQQPTVCPEPTGWRHKPKATVTPVVVPIDTSRTTATASLPEVNEIPKRRTMLGPPLAWRLALIPMLLFAGFNGTLAGLEMEAAPTLDFVDRFLWHQCIALVLWTLFVLSWNTRRNAYFKLGGLILFLALPTLFSAPAHSGGSRSIAMLNTLHLVMTVGYLLALILVRPTLGFSQESAAPDTSELPVTPTRLASEQTSLEPRRRASGSGFWKAIIGLLLLGPLLLFVGLMVLWLSYQSAAHRAVVVEQRAVADALAAISQEQFKAPQPIPEAMRGRWVVLTATSPEPMQITNLSLLVNGSADNAGGMSSPSSIPMMPGGSAMMGVDVKSGRSVATWLHSPQIIEITERELKLTSSRELSFNIASHEPGKFTLKHAEAPNEVAIRQGIYLHDGDRLVICWGPDFAIPPRDFVPSEVHQMLVCRREWSSPLNEPASADVSITPPDPFAGSGVATSTNATMKELSVPRADIPFTSREAESLQNGWAHKLGVDVEITNSIGMKLRLIPPGKLPPDSVSDMSGGFGGGIASGMGGGPGMPAPGGNVPASTTALGRDGVTAPIYVAIHEVTHGQFQQFIDDTGYVTAFERANANSVVTNSGERFSTWRSPRCQQDSDEHPVIDVVSNDAIAFTHWLSRKEKKPYRLLSLNEHEFVTRAGQRQSIEIGTDKLKHRSQFFSSTARSGSYSKNRFGLYDLVGNAAEWSWGINRIAQQSTSGGFEDAFGGSGNITQSLSAFFTGGDYATPIERSQPGSSQLFDGHANQLTTAIGFRVAVDLSTESLLPLKLSAMSTRERICDLQADAHWLDFVAAADVEKADAVPQRKVVVVVRDALPNIELPYAVNWTDIEIERAVSDKSPLNALTQSVKWEPMLLTDLHKPLEQFGVETEPLPSSMTDPVLTAPLVKTKDKSLTAAASHRTIDEELKEQPKSKQSNFVLVRFSDFSAQAGQHYLYRYRLKYVISGLASSPQQTTGWRVGRTSIAIPTDPATANTSVLRQ